MRFLCFIGDYIDDEEVWKQTLQWMLGDHLLIAPVTDEGARTWATYLPAGAWIDAWTGESYAGHQTVDMPAPLHRIPVFVRAEAWEMMQNIFTTRP